MFFSRVKRMVTKIYAQKSYKTFCKNAEKQQYKVNVGIDKIKDGVIVNNFSDGFGIFTADGKFVESSRQFRGVRSQFVPKNIPENPPYVDKEVVFLGNVYPHFGHFLLEHMNRAYALVKPEFHDMSVVLINNYDLKEVPAYVYGLLEAMGIRKENIIILNTTTRFKTVYVPQQSFNIPFFYADSFVDAFECMAERTNGKDYEKIYVSRAKLSSGKTYGEEEIQNIFKRNGFHIIYPETLPLKEQISFMKNCRVLAGCAGTALHLSLFMPKGGTVIQIKRNKKIKDNFFIQNLINSAKKLNSFYVSGSVEKVHTSHGSEMPQIIGMTKYMREFFNDNGFAYNQDEKIPNDYELEQYITAMKQFKSKRGNPFFYNVKKIILKLLACFVPGRINRSRFRKYMKRLLGIA